ncbi:MAG TPA: PKD domain-containing protein [Methanoregula sp.]|nr:PKD domain-containing protein [Methanoregula sp.]
MKTTPVVLGCLILIALVFLVAPVSADKPVASFITNESSGSIPLTVQFIDSSLNSPTSWTWLFGDGGTSTAQNPAHTYANAGSYTVTLIATNSAGSDTLTKTAYITATKAQAFPDVAFVTNVTSGAIPFAVQFLDTSTNNPTAWAWSFGDGGTTTERNPTHIYTTEGSYTVTLTATNSAGSNTISEQGYITASKVTDTPDPLFKSTVTYGFAPLNVQFVDASSNSPTAWIWSFGDGSTSTLQNPSHTYTSAGSYTVTLTATNSVGSNTITQTGYIIVEAAIPTSSFTANITNGVKPLTVQFTDKSDNAPTGWYWSFGDGGTSTLQNPLHTYNSAGTYSVSLGASNTAGSNTTTVSKYITVTDTALVPQASFTSNIKAGTAPLTVKFTDTSINSPTEWEWSFGDGLQDNGQNPTHTYKKSGTYTVSLIALNAAGHTTSTQPEYINVYSSAATATPTTITTTVVPTKNAVTAQPTVTPSVTTTDSKTKPEGLPSWALPLIGVVVLVLVIGALVIRARGRQRSKGGNRRSRRGGRGDL